MIHLDAKPQIKILKLFFSTWWQFFIHKIVFSTIERCFIPNSLKMIPSISQGRGDGTTDRIAISKKYCPLFQNYNSTVLKSQAYYLDIYYSLLISRLLIFLQLENFYWVESRGRQGDVGWGRWGGGRSNYQRGYFYWGWGGVIFRKG